jgi:hypothetical protein
MSDRRCHYCQQLFQPSRFHPQQAVCSQLSCQKQRRRDYHREKIASDSVYRQVCLESPRKWRHVKKDEAEEDGVGQFGSPTSTKLAQKKGCAAPPFVRRSRIIFSSASCSAAALLFPAFNEP